MNSEIQTDKALGQGTATARQAIQAGAALLSRAGVEGARLDAELLLAEALGFDRSKLYLNYELALDPRAQERFCSLLARRMGGEPVAYITGRREFWSLDFLVNRATLVPRPESELLVEVAIRLLSDRRRHAGPPLDLPLAKGEMKRGCAEHKPKILDLGTGSGAIAVSLAREIADVEIWATDVSVEALEVAERNARRHGAEEKIHFLSGDLFEPVRDRRGFFQMIVSNPPYVRRGELDRLAREIRHFEPRIALDGGEDGLDFYRRIIQEGCLYLAPGGFVALEIGAEMGAEVGRLFADVGCYSEARLYADYAGRDRVVSARKLK